MRPVRPASWPVNGPRPATLGQTLECGHALRDRTEQEIRRPNRPFRPGEGKTSARQGFGLWQAGQSEGHDGKECEEYRARGIRGGDGNRAQLLSRVRTSIRSERAGWVIEEFCDASVSDRAAREHCGFRIRIAPKAGRRAVDFSVTMGFILTTLYYFLAGLVGSLGILLWYNKGPAANR